MLDPPQILAWQQLLPPALRTATLEARSPHREWAVAWPAAVEERPKALHEEARLPRVVGAPRGLLLLLAEGLAVEELQPPEEELSAEELQPPEEELAVEVLAEA